MSDDPNGTPMVPISVLLVDDQRSFRESLSVVIDAQDDLVCIGAVPDGETGIAEAIAHHPSVVVMDVGLPDMDGVTATGRIVASDPQVRVVILTGRPDATTLARAASAGASAFLLKSASVEEILDAVRHESSRRLEVDAAALEAIFGSDPGGPVGLGELTQRELEVLGGLAEGRQPKRIASELGITVPTCRSYVKSVLQKLGAHSALEAVVIAHRHGLISLPDETV